TATSSIFTLSLHDALPILPGVGSEDFVRGDAEADGAHLGADANPKSNLREKMVFSFLWQPDRIIQVICQVAAVPAELTELAPARSEEHTSELQSRENLVCR